MQVEEVICISFINMLLFVCDLPYSFIYSWDRGLDIFS